MAEVSRKISDFGKTFFFLSKVERRFGVAAGTSIEMNTDKQTYRQTDKQNR